MKRTTLWPVVIVASALGIGVLAGYDIHSPIRPILTMWFLLVCSGMSFVRLLEIRDYVVEFVLGIALSITMTTIVSEILVLSKMWRPVRGLFILIGISMIGVVLQVIFLPRQSQTDGVEPDDRYTIHD